MLANCIDLVAHEGDMCLVHDLVEHAESSAVVKIYKDKLSYFLNEQGELLKHVYVELMAQSIAVWSGYNNELLQKPHSLGMLLGVRNYKLLESTDFEILLVHVEQMFVDGEIGAFDCSVEGECGTLVAKARLTVYQPESESSFLDKFKDLV